jgi:hypothetical protein
MRVGVAVLRRIAKVRKWRGLHALGIVQVIEASIHKAL